MKRDAWNRRYSGTELIWTAQPNRFLVAETEDLPPGRALDLACGEGRNAVWLARRGWTVTGVDFAGVGLEKARRLADEAGVDAEWIEADLLDYRPPAGQADLVILFYLQVREADRQAILRSAASAVAPGGTLLLVGHDASNLEHGHGGPQDPSVLYTAADVAADIEGSGLEIERGEVVERPVETAVALDVLVRARRR